MVDDIARRVTVGKKEIRLCLRGEEALVRGNIVIALLRTID